MIPFGVQQLSHVGVDKVKGPQSPHDPISPFSQTLLPQQSSFGKLLHMPEEKSHISSRQLLKVSQSLSVVHRKIGIAVGLIDSDSLIDGLWDIVDVEDGEALLNWVGFKEDDGALLGIIEGNEDGTDEGKIDDEGSNVSVGAIVWEGDDEGSTDKDGTVVGSCTLRL